MRKVSKVKKGELDYPLSFVDEQGVKVQLAGTPSRLLNYVDYRAVPMKHIADLIAKVRTKEMRTVADTDDVTVTSALPGNFKLVEESGPRHSKQGMRDSVLLRTAKRIEELEEYRHFRGLNTIDALIKETDLFSVYKHAFIAIVNGAYCTIINDEVYVAIIGERFKATMSQLEARGLDTGYLKIPFAVYRSFTTIVDTYLTSDRLELTQ